VRPPQEVVEEVLAAAGGDCVVLVEESSEAEVRFANNTTTTNGVRLDRRVTAVRFEEVPGGTAAGVARRSGEVDAVDLARAAGADARGGSPADDAEVLLAGTEHLGYGDEPGSTDLDAIAGPLASLAGAFDRARRAERVLSGFAEHRVATTYLGTSTGLRRRHLQPTGALHLVARSEDGTRSAWAGSAGPEPALGAIDDLEERACRGLAWSARRVELPAGRYEVVLPPAAVADLMVGLAEATGGREAEEGRTVFSAPDGRTRVGETLMALPFDLWSDPAAAGLECTPFLATSVSSSDVSVFDNGLPIERVDWIRGGALRRLRYHRAGAARSGVEVTPPVDNLVLDLPGADGDLDDLVARTERGLLLTCLWYIREVDPSTLLLTGLTRDGVYVVEDGEVVGAANNFRFNESPLDLLARVSEVGRAERTLGREFGEWVNRARMPPLRIPDFNMSSVSPAS
jgi:predicted Zn-dependent protease